MNRPTPTHSARTVHAAEHHNTRCRVHCCVHAASNSTHVRQVRGWDPFDRALCAHRDPPTPGNRRTVGGRATPTRKISNISTLYQYNGCIDACTARAGVISSAGRCGCLCVYVAPEGLRKDRAYPNVRPSALSGSGRTYGRRGGMNCRSTMCIQRERSARQATSVTFMNTTPCQKRFVCRYSKFLTMRLATSTTRMSKVRVNLGTRSEILSARSTEYTPCRENHLQPTISLIVLSTAKTSCSCLMFWRLACG